ncbi:PAS domain-containing sensor histidine kinase [Nocardioides marmoriginsengisoli]|uniref:Sensor-like histidine kinase SenX3 n=1 Tax=Nocardioides marmoriginsengisoli TaxID=661483 RepID=A0A3N0CP58_9ACTN|nr:PAS domain-containing sensor histidine kinase [Nocardioides marmoriginsengisoli]RNL65238.1 PAS domain-containing sensor histidine kinase [Nocardioides marmoriginsengisoli]
MTTDSGTTNSSPDLGGLLEAAPDAMVVIDQSGAIVLVNAQTLSVFGYARHELLGQPVEMLVPADLHSVHRQHRHDYVGEPHVRAMGSGLDLRARRKDGSEFPVEISLAPLETEDGLLISAAVRDVTSKRREERLFRGLLEAAPDAMVIVDQEGTILLVNAQVERCFGYDREELIGRSVEVLVPERFAGIHVAFRSGYVAGPRTRPMGLAGDLHARRKDGSEFPVEISLAPLETEDGLLISAAVRDISERRAMQEEAERVKDEFFATVSHELRTPLTSLLGYSELMADLEQLSPQGRRFLSVITRSAERELRLVDDLLTLVAIEESGLAIRPARVDLVPILRDAVEAARPRAEELHIELELDLPGIGLMINADRDRIGQAIDNLLSNALKFTPAGGEIGVRLRAVDGNAEIEVADSGMGIGEVEPNRVFERLYRSGTAVAQQVPGAGLGLTIALAIVEAHQGTIGVVKTDAHGTTFRMSFRVVEETPGTPVDGPAPWSVDDFSPAG